MSRESSYFAAGQTCSQVESAASELQSAVKTVMAEIDGIGNNWKGEAGSAMVEGLSLWCAEARALLGRINTLSSRMRSSQSYDYGLWKEEES